MKKQTTLIMNLLLILMLIFSSFSVVAAQSEETEEYIPVHTEEELQTLFSQVSDYLNNNGQEILASLDETEDQIINQALIRSWGIALYEDATPQQIDDAYDALFNMSLFMGLATDPQDTFSSGLLFQYAVQLLDQEYYDLLAAAGEDEENIEYAEYLRDISEALVEDPESFDAEEVEDWLFEIYQETYLAAGLKAIAHTEVLPLPEEIFLQEEETTTMMPNPVVEYETAEPLAELLGIEMPGMPEEAEAELGYYSIIADILAEAKYDLPDGAMVVLRLSRETEEDISGVYGAEYYEDWIIASTEAEIDTYLDMFIARGIVKTMDETEFSFAVDAEGVDEALFYKIVTYFIESCRNQKAAF